MVGINSRAASTTCRRQARAALVPSSQRLRIADGLPTDEVVLYMPVDRAEVSAVIVWRKQLEFGLKFTSPFRIAQRRGRRRRAAALSGRTAECPCRRVRYYAVRAQTRQHTIPVRKSFSSIAG